LLLLLLLPLALKDDRLNCDGGASWCAAEFALFVAGFLRIERRGETLWQLGGTQRACAGVVSSSVVCRWSSPASACRPRCDVAADDVT